MDEAQQVEMLFNLVKDLGMWAIFAALFFDERRRHEATRILYRQDLREWSLSEKREEKKEA